jgi:hypothetical protein
MMLTARNSKIESGKDGLTRVESVALLFEIDRAISADYQQACEELDIAEVVSLVRFLTELDILAMRHYFSPREIITLLDPTYFQESLELTNLD